MGRFELPPDRAAALDALTDEPLDLRGDIERWSAGRSWLARLPLLAYFVWVMFHSLRDWTYSSLLFSGVNFGVHELGHIVFAFLPLFFSVAAGSVCQLAAPLAAGWMFYRQRDYFAITVAAFWFFTSLRHLSIYLGDAKLQRLDLIGPGSGDPIHDWNYMLAKLGLLEQCETIAKLASFFATLIGLTAIAAGGWILWLMFQQRAVGRRFSHDEV